MFKKRFLILAFMCGFIYTYSQSCFSSGITFSTQEEINNFPIDNPNCVEIGRVLIEGNDIDNLNPLAQLQSIVGSLIIQNCPNLIEINIGNQLTEMRDTLFVENNPNLISINGFNSIDTIGNLSIRFNPVLNEINGFESLIEITNDFDVRGSNLTQLSPFTALEQVGNDFTVGSLMKQLSGFEKVERIGGTMDLIVDSIIVISAFKNLENISGNLRMQVVPNLEDMSGFISLHTIGGAFILGNNIGLKDFYDLESLDSIGTLSVAKLNAIESFEGLENLKTIKNELAISECQNLRSLKGLQNATILNPTFLILFNNPQLKHCSIRALCESINDFFGIPTSNGVGCSSIEEVLEHCTLDSTFINQDICLGETLNIGNETYTDIGFYEQTLTSCFGLDSVLNITIIESNDCDNCYVSIPVLGVQIMKEKETYVIEFEDHTRKQFESIDNLVVFLEKTNSRSNALRSNKNKLHFRTTQLEQLLINLKPGGVLKM